MEECNETEATVELIDSSNQVQLVYHFLPHIFKYGRKIQSLGSFFFQCIFDYSLFLNKLSRQ